MKTDIEIPFTEDEKESFRKLAQEIGVSVEEIVKTLSEEGTSERLRTSQKIGSETTVIDFKGPQNGLKRGK